MKKTLGKVLITFEGKHDETKSYKRLSRVTTEDGVYISKVDVPANTKIDNDVYWEVELVYGGDASRRFKVDDAVENDEAVNMSQLSDFSKSLSKSGIMTHSVTTARDIQKLINAAPIGGHITIKFQNDIELDVEISLAVNLAIDLNGHKLTFCDRGDGVPRRIQAQEHINPVLYIHNGRVETTDYLPDNGSTYVTGITAWISRLRVVLRNTDICLNKGGLINAHSLGGLDVKVSSSTVSKGDSYQDSSSIVNGSGGSYLLNVGAITYNNDLTKSDVFNGTYI